MGLTKKNLEADGNILHSKTPDDTPYRDNIDNTTPLHYWESEDEKPWMIEERMPWQYKESSRRSKRYHAEFREEYSYISHRVILVTMGVIGTVMAILAANGLINLIRYW